MKNQILFSFILLGMINTINAQITNTFPLDDSVGIGTTTPTELFEVWTNAKINGSIVGHYPLSGLIIGSQLLESNTTGSSNMCIGAYILRDNTTGEQNIGIGADILDDNISGSGNLGIGQFILSNNLSGEHNIAIAPYGALRFSNGNRNIAIGNSTLDFAYTADDNVAVGDLSMHVMTKARYNTAVGSATMSTMSKGNGNTALGYSAGPGISSCNNSTAIGSGTTVDASNKVRIGNASVTSNGGQVSWTAYSDARIKNNVKENVPGLEFIKLLKPVTYHFDVDKQNTISGVQIKEQVENMYEIEQIQFTGFLAQDVDAAAKQLNYDFSGVDKSGEILGLRYAEFVVPLVKAVQELSQQNEALQNENAELTATTSDLQNRIAKLEKIITKKGVVTQVEITESTATQKVSLSGSDEAILYQNIPNPFNGKTIIQYFIPETVTNAQIQITNANGVVLKTIDITSREGQIELDATKIASGSYLYSLVIDGRVTDTKQMLLVK